MPSTKNVALAPSSSSRSRIAAVWRSRACPRVSQSARPRPRCTSWCQSSKSKLSRSLAMAPTLGGRLRRRPARPQAGFARPAAVISEALKRLAPTILVAALLVATATAFAVTERLKLEDSPVISTTFAARFSPKLVEERIGFRLRREEDISLDIADSNGNTVKEGVGSGVFGQAYHQFAWDGRDDLGRIVPDGTYRVELTLKDEDRTIEFPRTITVDSTPP